MRRVLEQEEFQQWFEGFVPMITDPPYDSILQPVGVEADSDDGLELQFVGLNPSKAWSMAGIASAVEAQKFSKALEQGAQRHVEYSLDLAFTDEYAGAHWLPSFVRYLLTRHEGGIEPE